MISTIAETPHLWQMHIIVLEFCKTAGIQLNPNKCKILAIKENEKAETEELLTTYA